MNEQLKSKVDNAPETPGVYQFINDKGKVLYVGKAKNLKNRVRSYFQANLPSARIEVMTRKIHDIEMIVTDSEIEALVLENNLIKQLKPRYNVLLKDDKSFPYIKVTNEPYPRIFPTRRIVRDGSRYYGPYTDVKNMKSSLRMINHIFKIRSCKLALTDEAIGQKKFKVCLDYHIKKCDGPCEGHITQQAYRELVNEAGRAVSGKTGELIKELSQRMQDAAMNLHFELAADLRDKLQKLESLSERQKIVSEDDLDRDIIAIAHVGRDAACSIFTVRTGKLISKKQIALAVDEDTPIDELYLSTIKQYYANEYVDIPREIILEIEPPEDESLAEWLSERAVRKVNLFSPKRGDLKSLVRMCRENANLQLGEIQLQKMKRDGNVPHTLASLKRDLRLSKLPRRIECFDISNLQSSDIVAGMVVFVDGKPRKSEYRKFIIEGIDGPNDFESMFQVISRRYKRLLDEQQPLPELIMIDGGKGQLSSAAAALREVGVKQFEAIGLAKRLEEVFLVGDPNPVIIPKTSSALKLLQVIRDETHRFAITFHRLRRSKRIISTELSDIKGIGGKTAESLLKHFESLTDIKEATTEQLEAAIGRQKGRLVWNFFHGSELPGADGAQEISE
jgi:excinuclease ABC subunit C